MYCRKCGNEIKYDSKFCEECGANVQQEASAPVKKSIFAVVLIAVIISATVYAIQHFKNPDNYTTVNGHIISNKETTETYTTYTTHESTASNTTSLTRTTVTASSYNIYEEEQLPYTDYNTYTRLRVCYDTPYHAGLNMRSEPTSASEKISLVTEGTVVDVLKDYHPGDNSYIYVGYKDSLSGEYYKGWVLVEYLEYNR